ncbi:MAG: hypothetical protein EA423_01870 [Phycisphaerales bacterium]|nr:MAG: hypothetical protein EA423_01870 [Phycisphaerales bacterium]
MQTEPSILLLRFGLLIVVAAVFGVLLRRCGLPGGRPASAIVGGAIAGVLLGPMVLGAAAPGLHTSMTVGGLQELRELETRRTEMIAERDRELAVLREIDVSAVALDEHEAEFAELLDAELRPYRQSLDMARKAHREASGAIVAGLAAWVFALAGVAGRFRKRKLRVDERRTLVVAGVVAVVVTAGVVAVIVQRLFTLSRDEAVAIGAAVGAGSAFALLPMRWVASEGRAGSGWYGFAGLIVACGAMAAFGSDEIRGYALVALGGLAIGWVARPAVAGSRRMRRIATPLALYAGVGPLTAFMVSMTEPAAIFSGWTPAFLAIALFLIAGLPQWLGAVLALGAIGGAELGERKSQRRLELHARGVPLTQMVLLALVCAAGVLDPASSLGAAIVAGVVLGAIENETTVGMARSLLKQVEEME